MSFYVGFGAACSVLAFLFVFSDAVLALDAVLVFTSMVLIPVPGSGFCFVVYVGFGAAFLEFVSLEFVGICFFSFWFRLITVCIFIQHSFDCDHVKARLLYLNDN